VAETRRVARSQSLSGQPVKEKVTKKICRSVGAFADTSAPRNEGWITQNQGGHLVGLPEFRKPQVKGSLP
jgi:hypothetical protein